MAMYSKGMSQRDIEDNLREIYGADISQTLIVNPEATNYMHDMGTGLLTTFLHREKHRSYSRNFGISRRGRVHRHQSMANAKTKRSQGF